MINLLRAKSMGPLAVAIALLVPGASAEVAGPGSAVQAQGAPLIEVANIGFMEGTVEFQRGTSPWAAASENQTLAIGDRVRTQKGAAARLDFPWTAIALGDASEVALDDNRVLTLRLESGRIDIDPEQTLLRVVTDEASISGSGRTLVRRSGTTTFVASYNGGANVLAKGESVRLGIGKGTIVNAGAGPSASAPLAPGPLVVSPGADPRYVRPGEAVHLVWKGREPSYHVEVLPIDSDVPMLSLDVDAQEFDLRLDLLGTFRWRVSGRTGPVETQPSGEGLICVVEK